jgi:sphingomyelin phosphodiesterase
MRPECDSECKKRLLCDSKSGRSHDRKYFCKDVESKIDDDKSWSTWILNSFSVS